MWTLATWCFACLITACNAQLTGEQVQDVRVSVTSRRSLVIPCVGLKPDDKVSILHWYKGATIEEALNTVLIRYDSSGTGKNYTAGEKYQLRADFSLIIYPVEPTDAGRYWCHVVIENYGVQQEDPVDVTIVSPVEHVVSSCSKLVDNVCSVIESRRLILDCWATDAFLKPNLSWAFIGCSENTSQSQQWFLSNQRSIYDEDTSTYNVSQGVFLGRLELEKDETCSFQCTTTGGAIVNESSTIVNGSSSITVVVTGKGKKPNNGQDPGDNTGNDNTTPSSGLNLGFMAVIIVLAFVSLVCLIGIVYLFSRVWCSRGSTLTAEEVEMNKTKENRDEKMCLLHAESGKGNTQDIIGEMTRWQYKGKLSKKLKGTGDTLQGVTGVLPSAGGGLVIATQYGLQCFSSNFTSISIKEDSDLSQDNIISITNHPNCDLLIVGLETGGLVFVNVLTGKTKSVFPNEIDPDSQFSTSEIAVDDVGTIFAGPRNDRSIFMMETCTTYVKKFRIDINLVSLTAYGSKHVFVSNGKDTIKKYHFKRAKGGYDMLKFKNWISVYPIGNFGIKRITVHAGLLYAVNGYDTGCRILQYDVETFDILQTFCTNLCDLQGLCFFGEFKVALYETNSVKIYEKREADELDNYVLV
ncbi:uncharacterized protein LOC110974978 [Acanthaster planci]|uniref:Uncharacterized protein LOC110974978 n=1 Tax=Acanthaster planci TaxID=133434 RepID=A0A8B7XR50_ACAPL|nr:uncharacterized protein LOC110974978 [Acanthaster planci]